MVYRILAVVVTAFLFSSCGSGSTPEGPPSVISDSMGDGSSVSITPSLVFAFNKDIDETRNGAANVYLYDANQTRLAGTATVKGDRLSFTPTARLAYDSNYSVSVSGVIDLTSTAMKHAYSRNFTTTPFFQTISPANSESNVSVFSDIILKFGEAQIVSGLSVTVSNLTFNTTTVDNKTFTLSPSGGTNFDSNYSGLLPSTSYTVTIAASADIYGTNLPAPVTATFSTVPPDVTAPVILSRTPANGSSAVAADTTITFIFDEDIITPTTAQVSMVDDALATVAVGIAYDDTAKTLSLTPSSVLDYARGYTITLSNVSDVFGNTMSDTMTFTTSTILTSTFPKNGDTGVPVDTSLAALFEGEINASAALFTLKNSSGASVTGTSTFATSTARFVPASDLAYATQYTATISGVRDTYGNLLADQSWSFMSRYDDLPPQLLSSTPADQATAVSTSSSVTAVFDEPVNGDNITMSLQSSDGLSVEGSVSVSGSSVTFDPSASLKSGETYTVYLSGVTDTSGNKAVVRIWTFETL